MSISSKVHSYLQNVKQTENFIVLNQKESLGYPSSKTKLKFKLKRTNTQCVKHRQYMTQKQTETKSSKTNSACPAHMYNLPLSMLMVGQLHLCPYLRVNNKPVS